MEASIYRAMDGLNTAEYQVKKVEFLKLFTHIQVSINGPINALESKQLFNTELYTLRKMYKILLRAQV